MRPRYSNAKNCSFFARKIIFLVSVISGLASTAHSQSAELRWGGDSEGGAPYVFQDPRNPRNTIGFEVELAAALASKLKRKPVFIQNQWDGLIPGLERGNYDLALNGLEITDERRKVINFSIPYYVTTLQLSVRVEENKVNSLADLKGRKVGTLKYSLAQTVLEREKALVIRTYDGLINAYQDLAVGRLDAVLNDYPIAVYYSKPNPKIKFAGQPIERVLYGIGIRKDDSRLLSEINAALLDLMRSGELRQIYGKWGLENRETDDLFASLTKEGGSQPRALEDFTQAMTHQRTWRERIRQYSATSRSSCCRERR